MAMYIVDDQGEGRGLFKMNEKDFRFNSPGYDYEQITKLKPKSLGKVMHSNGHRATVQEGVNGVHYLIFSDYSAVVKEFEKCEK